MIAARSRDPLYVMIDPPNDMLDPQQTAKSDGRPYSKTGLRVQLSELENLSSSGTITNTVDNTGLKCTAKPDVLTLKTKKIFLTVFQEFKAKCGQQQSKRKTTTLSLSATSGVSVIKNRIFIFSL